MGGFRMKTFYTKKAFIDRRFFKADWLQIEAQAVYIDTASRKDKALGAMDDASKHYYKAQWPTN